VQSGKRKLRKKREKGGGARREGGEPFTKGRAAKKAVRRGKESEGKRKKPRKLLGNQESQWGFEKARRDIKEKKVAQEYPYSEKVSRPYRGV